MPPSDTTRAAPGEVQATVDRVHERGGGTVFLDGAERYDPDETIHVRPGVALDFDGAILEPTADRDLFHVHPCASVRWPRVHLPSADWSSTVFTFDTQYGPYHPHVYEGDVQYTGSGVFGGYTRGVDRHDEPNGARAFFVNNRGDHDRVDCVTWLQVARHQTYYVDTVFDLRCDDPENDRWTNGNYFGGLHWAHDVCIRTRGEGKINGNTFALAQTQPRNYSDCFWDLQQGKGNTVVGMLWDTQRYEKFLRVATDSADPPVNNLLWTQRLAGANDDVGRNYVLTNESFGPLSVVGEGSAEWENESENPFE